MDLKNFKQIADEAMEDMKADELLKQKTLRRCTEKKQSIPGIRILAYAACLALILGSAKISGLFGPLKEQTPPNSTLMTSEAPQILMEPGPGPETEWQVRTKDEVRELFKVKLELPEFIPSPFELDQIMVSGRSREDVTKAVFTYTAEDGSFMLMAQLSELNTEFTGFEEVELNGVPGYLKTQAEFTDTELYWSKDGIQYSILGSITKDDAVKIALSMQ